LDTSTNAGEFFAFVEQDTDTSLLAALETDFEWLLAVTDLSEALLTTEHLSGTLSLTEREVECGDLDTDLVVVNLAAVTYTVNLDVRTCELIVHYTLTTSGEVTRLECTVDPLGVGLENLALALAEVKSEESDGSIKNTSSLARV